jgi:hypothetical protein
MEYEMNKRRFWTAYFLDRDISFAIGTSANLPGVSHDVTLIMIKGGHQAYRTTTSTPRYGLA